MPSTNRPSQQDRFRKIVAAIPRYLSNLTQIILAGVTFTPASLVQFFLDQIKMLDDATAARAALHSASQAIKAAKGTKGPILKAFNDFILSMFANQPTALADFVVNARKTAVKPVNQKALAAAKGDATRKARNTMGKKQKAKVKGTVAPAILAVLDPSPGPVHAPSVANAGAPPQPVASPAPAPAAGPPAASPGPVAAPAAPAQPAPASPPPNGTPAAQVA